MRNSERNMMGYSPCYGQLQQSKFRALTLVVWYNCGHACTGRGGLVHQGVGNAQDGAGLAAAGQVGGADRRRQQPPHGPVRHDDDQGQPCDGSRGHQRSHQGGGGLHQVSAVCFKLLVKAAQSRSFSARVWPGVNVALVCETYFWGAEACINAEAYIK